MNPNWRWKLKIEIVDKMENWTWLYGQNSRIEQFKKLENNKKMGEKIKKWDIRKKKWKGWGEIKKGKIGGNNNNT